MLAGLKELFRKPLSQALVLFVGGLFLYAFLGRPAEYIQDFAIKDNYAYLASSAEGLRVISLSDPENFLSEVGFFTCENSLDLRISETGKFFNCANHASSVFIQENQLLMTDEKRGLFLFDISDPTNPALIDRLQLRGTPQDVVAVKDKIYVAAGRAGLLLVETEKTSQTNQQGNIPDKKLSLKLVDDIEIERNAFRVFTNNNIIYVSNNNGQLFLLDLNGKSHDEDQEPMQFEDNIYDMKFVGNLAYLAAGSQGLLLKTISEGDPNLSDYSQQKVGENEMVVSVDIRGNYAYLAVINKGLVIVDITNPQTPRIVQKPFSEIPSPKKIVLDGQTTYMTDGLDTLYALDARVVFDNKQVGKSGEPLDANEIVAVNNLAYVAAGERGLRILDITQADLPKEIAFADTAGSAVAVAINPPIAYLADRNNGLVSVDISNPSGLVPVVDQDPSKDARDVVVSSGYAYLADYEEGLKVYNLSEPKNPELIKVMDPIDGITLKPLSVSAYGDYVYLSSGSQGVDVVNVIDPRIPTRVQILKGNTPSDTQNVAVFGFDPRALSVPGQDPFIVDPLDPSNETYAYIANGQYGLQIWKVSDPKNQPPVLLDPGTEITSLEGNARSISIVNNRAYLAYDGFGIYVLDISRPEKPLLIGKSEITTSDRRVADITTQTGLTLTANLNQGVSIYNSTDPANLALVGVYSAPSSVRNMVVEGNYAYTVDGDRGLWVYDVSDPKFAGEIGFLDIPKASGIAVEKSYAYVSARELGLFVIDITNPRNPMRISGLDTGGDARRVLVKVDQNGTRYGYIANGDQGLAVVNLDILVAPTRIAILPSPSPAIKLTNWQDYLFISLDQNGIASVNILKPDQPVLMQVKKDAEVTISRGASIFAPYAYLASGTDGFSIVDVSYPLVMVGQATIDVNGEWVEDTATSGQYLFLAVKDQGIKVYDIYNPLLPEPVGEINSPEKSQEDQNPPISTEIVQVYPVWLPPAEGSNDPGIFRVYVADVNNGFFIVEGTKKAEVKIKSTYQTFGTPSLNSIVQYLRSKTSENTEGIDKAERTFRQYFTDIILFGVVASFLWLGYIAMFILPIGRFIDWENLYSRLIYFLFGRHGILLRIREGKVYPPREEEQENEAMLRYGPGSLIVDSSSAVVLERRNPIGRGMENQALARVVTGGVNFTGNRVFFTLPRFDELVRGIADLRPQIRLASEVRVYTRDGIELETVVFSIFTLGERPDVLTVAYAQPEAATDDDQANTLIPSEDDLRVVELETLDSGNLRVRELRNELDADDRHEIHQFMLSGSPMFPNQQILDELNRPQNTNGAPYLSDPVRVFQAVYAQAMDIPEDRELDWSELPNFVTIALLRDLLAREVYDNLYIPIHPTRYPIRNLRNQLRLQARNQGVLAFRLMRQTSQQPLVVGQVFSPNELLSSQVQILTNARNNTKILRTRGIKVRFVGFTQLRPVRDEVRLQFLDYWRAQRQRDADFILGDLELRALRLRNQWRIEAQREILNEFINILDTNPDADQALAMHVMQALEAAAADPDTRSLLPEETIEMLRSLRAWLRP